MSNEELELYSAIVNGDAEKIRRILETNPSLISSRDFNDRTPLHVAAIYWRLRSVEVLLDKGADVNAKDGVGCTPLHLAAGLRKRDTVEVLLAHGADVNASDGRGLTALATVELLRAGEKDPSRAVELGDMATLLREHGAR
jgi:ankyrin repeat protein